MLLIVPSLLLGALALVAFVARERRARGPMMPLTLFRSRNFTGANLLTLLLYAGLGGALYIFPFVLIQVHGYSATAAGAAFLPFVITFLMSRWAGGLVARYGARPPLTMDPRGARPDGTRPLPTEKTSPRPGRWGTVEPAARAVQARPRERAACRRSSGTCAPNSSCSPVTGCRKVSLSAWSQSRCSGTGVP